MPTSFDDALCLKASPAADGPFRRPKSKPPAALCRLIVASEAYHKVIGRRCMSEGRWRTVPHGRISAAAKSAARKYRGV